MGFCCYTEGEEEKVKKTKGGKKKKKHLDVPPLIEKKKIKKEIETQVVISVKACPQCTKYLKT